MTNSASSLRIGVVGVPGKWSSERLADAIAERTGFRLLVDMSEVAIDLDRRRATLKGIELRELDALIVKKVDRSYGWSNLDRLEMLRFLQGMGVRIFSRPERLMRLIDRLSCTVTLRTAGIPMPETIVTERADVAAEAVMAFEGAVLKPLYSTKARGMRLIEPTSFERVMEQTNAFQAEGNPVIYVQRRIELPDRDYGVAFVGGKYLGTYARVRAKGAWDTTTMAGGHYAQHQPSPQIIEMAQHAQALFDLDFAAVDVAETRHGTYVFEVSAFGGFRGLSEGAGIDAAAHIADHVIEVLRHE